MRTFFRFIKFIYYVYRVNCEQSEINVNKLSNITKQCGTLTIKLLQFIVMREDKFKKLNFVFENCDVHGIEKTKKKYLQDFGRTISQDFSNLEIKASGSIGQVYRAYSYKLNKFVALKSKHPGIDAQIVSFEKIIKIACWFMYPFNVYHYIIMEYLESVKLQLDYKKEAHNTFLYREKWINEPTVLVPEVYFYSDNFIVMEYIEGTDYNQLNDKQKRLASLYISFINLTGLLVHDFVHGDLHTGNWKIIFENNVVKNIIIYDCGIIYFSNDLNLNKCIATHVLAGTFDKLIYIIGKNENEKKLDSISKYIKENLPKDSANSRLQFFINTIIQKRISVDSIIINIIGSLGITGKITLNSSDIYIKYIDEQIHQCLIYMYIGLLNNIGVFGELKNFLEKWMSPQDLEIYSEWLFNKFGHKKKVVLDNIIYSKFKI